MIKIIHCSLLMLVVAFVAACVDKASQLDLVGQLPIMDAAYNIDKRSLASNSNQQLSYKLNSLYPSKTALEFYSKHFKSNGWKKCVGPIEKWSSFIDAAHTEKKRIHNIAHYWLKGSDMQLAIVFLRYNSKWPGNSDVPDSNVQNIFVLMQKDMGNLSLELSSLSVECN